MYIKIYVENKCYQCWLCKNRVGSDHHGLPECKVTQKYMYEIYEEPCHYFEPTERAKDLIIKSTGVQEIVHGEWIYNKTSTLWECSNCHEEEIRSTTYCPHCGARNRGGR